MIWVSQIGFLFLLIAVSLLLSGVVLGTRHLDYQKFVGLIRLSSLAIVLSYCVLTLCFLTNTFQLNYVLAHSSSLLPWYYKFCAAWGGHEGSILLWVTILALWTFVLTFQLILTDKIFATEVLKVLSIILLGLLCFIIFTSNPFSLQFIETNTLGRDLNPLLQDPGFLFHPPMLYLGYVGYAIPFAFAMAGLSLAKLDAQYLKLLKPWAMLSWCCLTLGITLGSWWAYRELGWGGFWFWDPVENASLMPWLAGTALLHALLVSERQQTFLAWTVLMAITAFALSLIGTFIVRSGVLTSVHAFAVDPKRGLYILIFLGLMLLWASILYAIRAHRLFINKPVYWFSRESSLLINNILLVIMLFVVLLGTLYPMIIDGLNLGKISVGAPYFNETLVPILYIFLFFMALGIQIKWVSDDANRVVFNFFIQACGALVLSLFVSLLVFNGIKKGAVVALSLAFWVILSVLLSLYHRVKQHHQFPRKWTYWAMFFAHIGFACSIIGIAVSTSYGVEKDVKISPFETVQLQDYKVRFLKESEIAGPNYQGTEIDFEIKKLSFEKHVYPQKRIYKIGDMVMTDADIHYNLWRDIYVALGSPVGKHDWSIRLYYKPMIRWIWLGGLLMTLGGSLALIYYIKTGVRKLK
jgi:cytochrome c-type biogenesis protein CcmF